MSDRYCHTCREPYEVLMELDAEVKDVQRWLEEEYGEGFRVVDVGGVTWVIKSCPFDPPGAKPSTAGMEADFQAALYD